VWPQITPQVSLSVKGLLQDYQWEPDAGDAVETFRTTGKLDSNVLAWVAGMRKSDTSVKYSFFSDGFCMWTTETTRIAVINYPKSVAVWKGAKKPVYVDGRPEFEKTSNEVFSLKDVTERLVQQALK
jgi:hypothetical protein